jgi:hypothetical protein
MGEDGDDSGIADSEEGADAATLRQAGDGTEPAETTSAFSAPVLIEETSRSGVLLGAEIALAAVAAIAFLGSIIWAWRRRASTA